MAEERSQISKAFVESKDVRVRGFSKISANPVDDRVGYFVSDYVVRQTCKDALAREVLSLLAFFGGEVAEKNSFCFRAVEGIGLDHRMGKEIERPDVVLL